jgi:hypothetical protein
MGPVVTALVSAAECLACLPLLGADAVVPEAGAETSVLGEALAAGLAAGASVSACSVRFFFEVSFGAESSTFASCSVSRYGISWRNCSGSWSVPGLVLPGWSAE